MPSPGDRRGYLTIATLEILGLAQPVRSTPTACLRRPPACGSAQAVAFRCLTAAQVALLTMKTAAKPLASQFEKYVMGRATTRQHVINIAQVRRSRVARACQPGLQQKRGRGPALMHPCPLGSCVQHRHLELACIERS